MTKQHDLEVRLLSGFVRTDGTGGNPAGAVLDADGLSESEMQHVAAEVGNSETAFLSRSKTDSYKLDFFTPTRRIAQCGHATIAAFSYLALQGILDDGDYSMETVDGSRRIVIQDGIAQMEQTAPSYTDTGNWPQGIDVAGVLTALNLLPDVLDPAADPVVVDTGNRFLLVGVNDEETLASIKPDQKAVEQISDALDLIGFYVFVTDNGGATVDASTRMFAPRYGIPEESATGMAAGPLACVLHDRLGHDRPSFVIEQGRHMPKPSPSVIEVQLDRVGSRINGLMAGGRGASQGRRTVSLGGS